ncbi:hypothetical protein, partial [Lachnoclostridium sp.]|uniref:hypothetical protein n=1 Tax=Lachnoclostridium sp. TaxID=2028282 RepID=UPI00289B47FE
DTNVSVIETIIGAIETIVVEIQTQVSVIDTNVARIETNIAIIETLLGHLHEIETQVAIIDTNVAKIETLLGPCTILTTGPILRDNGTNSVVVKVLNNAIETVTNVSSILFNIETCPKVAVETVVFAPLPPKCSDTFIFGDLSNEFEILFLGITTEVFVSVAARRESVNAPITSNSIVEPNSFRFSELSCTNDPPKCHR